jgi:hypothetical protein
MTTAILWSILIGVLVTVTAVLVALTTLAYRIWREVSYISDGFVSVPRGRHRNRDDKTDGMDDDNRAGETLRDFPRRVQEIRQESLIPGGTPASGTWPEAYQRVPTASYRGVA